MAAGVLMKDFRNLEVWSKAHSLTLNCYKATGGFPRTEQFGITSQIRRCAASIGANIAEGCGKRGNGERQRFLGIAAGSASELQYHFLLAKDLSLLATEEYDRLNSAVVEVKRMLASLILKIDRERLTAECSMLSAECLFLQLLRFFANPCILPRQNPKIRSVNRPSRDVGGVEIMQRVHRVPSSSDSSAWASSTSRLRTSSR